MKGDAELMEKFKNYPRLMEGGVALHCGGRLCVMLDFSSCHDVVYTAGEFVPARSRSLTENEASSPRSQPRRTAISSDHNDRDSQHPAVLMSRPLYSNLPCRRLVLAHGWGGGGGGGGNAAPILLT